jgi:hypothetical protein
MKMGSIFGVVSSVLAFMSSDSGQKLIAAEVQQLEDIAAFVERLVTHVTNGVSAAAGASVATPAASAAASTKASG